MPRHLELPLRLGEHVLGVEVPGLAGAVSSCEGLTVGAGAGTTMSSAAT